MNPLVRHGRAIHLISLSALGLIAYGLTLNGFFLSDDLNYLLGALRNESLGAGLEWSTSHPRFFRPVTLMSWWLNARLGGTHPLGYHLVGLTFHVLNAWLVTHLALALFGRPAAAFCAGLLFVLLPLHAEAVTWISARGDVLCTAGALTCLLLWVRFLREGAWTDLALSAGALVWAVLSKEMAVSVPVLAGILASVASRRSISARRAAAGLALLATIVLVFLFVRYLLLGGAGGSPRLSEGLVASYDTGLAVATLTRGVSLCLVPPAFATPAWLRLLPAACIASGLVLGFRAGTAREMGRILGTGIVLFAIALIPFAGLFTIYGDLEGTRILYLPSAFLCIALGSALVFADVARGSGTALPVRLGGVLVVAGVLCAQGLALVRVNRDWREAAAAAERMITTLPAPATGDERVVVCGVPRRLGAANLFRNGFTQAARHFASWPDAIVMPTRAAWDQARLHAVSRDIGDARFLRWDGSRWLAPD